MASKQQKQMQKRKERERTSKEKVLKKREVIRSEAREKREDFRKGKKIKKLQRDISSLGQWANQVGLENVSENTLNQLEKNAEILRGLEAEYDSEIQAKGLMPEVADNIAEDFYRSVPFDLPEEYPVKVRTPSDTAEVGVVKAAKDTAEVNIVKSEEVSLEEI